MTELLRPGTFSTLVAVEPIVHSPAFSQLAMSGGELDNPMAAGARRRRADFQSRYEATMAASTVCGPPPDERRFGRPRRAGRSAPASEEAHAFFASKSLFKPWDRRALDVYVVREAGYGASEGHPAYAVDDGRSTWGNSVRTFGVLRRTVCASGRPMTWPSFLARGVSPSSARRPRRRYGVRRTRLGRSRGADGGCGRDTLLRR